MIAASLISFMLEIKLGLPYYFTYYIAL